MPRLPAISRPSPLWTCVILLATGCSDDPVDATGSTAASTSTTSAAASGSGGSGGGGGAGGGGAGGSTVAVRDVSGGEQHTVALLPDGTVLVAGNNADGQLGLGEDHATEVGVATGFTPLPEVGDLAAVVAGSVHTYLVDDDRRLFASGYNDGGRLGTGDAATTRIYTPTEVQIDDVELVATGGEHTLAIDGDGDLWAWGRNVSGEVGNGSTAPVSVPVELDAPRDVVQVAVGAGSHSVALDASGRVYTWGNNSVGQLGDQTTVNATTPQILAGLPDDVVAVAAGERHGLARTAVGELWAWGANDRGQLGIGEVSGAELPTRVGGLGVVTAMAAGLEHSMALTDDGTVWVWGNGGSYVGGNDSPASSAVPVAVQGLTGVAAIRAGHFTAFARTGDGTWYGWGLNDVSQLGGAVDEELGRTPTPLFPASR